MVTGKVETVVNQGNHILAQGIKDLEGRMFTVDSGNEYLVSGLSDGQGLLRTIKNLFWTHAG